MKLATLRDGTRDGTLIVVRRDGKKYAPASDIAPNLQVALDNWEEAEPKLLRLAEKLEEGTLAGSELDVTKLDAPLPRAYEW
ncbi:MAG: 2-keto-4-pentenoate hydratase, partial [Bradymonadaceae bacterium]